MSSEQLGRRKGYSDESWARRGVEFLYHRPTRQGARLTSPERVELPRIIVTVPTSNRLVDLAEPELRPRDMPPGAPDGRLPTYGSPFPARATRAAARYGQLANRPEADEWLRIRRPLDRTRLLRRQYSPRAAEYAAKASGVRCRALICRCAGRRGLRADAAALRQACASLGLELSDARGHVETGQMDWEVWKWLDDGHVELHSRRLRPARIPNPIVRLAFHLLRDRERNAFLASTKRRMRTFTEQALTDEEPGPHNPRRRRRRYRTTDAPYRRRARRGGAQSTKKVT